MLLRKMHFTAENFLISGNNFFKVENFSYSFCKYYKTGGNKNESI